MSEYQYYEFRTVDRTLTHQDMRELRAISSRARITRTSFSNHYTYGDLKADHRQILRRYFDASLYFAHWSYVEVAFRFPVRTVDTKALRRYAGQGRSVAVQKQGGDVILTMAVDGEGDTFDLADDGRQWLSSLLPLRADIGSGDHRALYLGWLLDVQYGLVGDDTLEPVVPCGLGTLSPALECLVSVLGLDHDLVDVAVESSPPVGPATSDDHARAWLERLERRDLVDLLARIVRGDTAVIAQMRRESTRNASAPHASASPRSAGLLRARADALASARRTHDVNREQARLKLEEEAAHQAREESLEALAHDELAAWRRVEAQIATTRPGAYVTAVNLLVDLREAGRRGLTDGAAFERRLARLKAHHARKPALLARLAHAGL